MWGCEAFQRAYPTAYVGYQILDDGRIEHLLLSENSGLKRVKLKMDCDKCVLGRLVKSSKLVSMPTVLDDGKKIRFVTTYNREVKRILSEHRSQLVSVEVLDLRSVVLTRRQRELLRIVANGAGTSPSRVAVRLGVSRQAAQKLLTNLVKKIATIMA
jgi:DNA-binding CsgD family transcriptional regulator